MDSKCSNIGTIAFIVVAAVTHLYKVEEVIGVEHKDCEVGTAPM